jgi:hypothetical protein
MTAAAVLDALRSAPADSARLASLAGCQPATVRSTVRRLQRRGYVFANDGGGGGGRGRRAVYRLLFDPESPDAERVCAWDGCGARLAADNRGRFCAAHERKLYELAWGVV